LDFTFRDLIYAFQKANKDAFLPDFWSKKKDCKQNCVTTSTTWWEYQHPRIKVLDAITKQNQTGERESLGIERVIREKEYVIALVEMDEVEKGVPIGENSYTNPHSLS